MKYPLGDALWATLQGSYLEITLENGHDVVQKVALKADNIEQLIATVTAHAVDLGMTPDQLRPKRPLLQR